MQQFVEKKIENWLELEINREKTKVCDLRQGEEFHFLGYTFHMQRDLKGRRHKYLCPEPSKKSIQKAKEEIRNLTQAKYCFVPIPDLIKRLNRFLDGWGNYFTYGYSRKAKRVINAYARERMTKHLQRRSQRRYRPPEGTSYYEQIGKLGLKYL